MSAVAKSILNLSAFASKCCKKEKWNDWMAYLKAE